MRTLDCSIHQLCTHPGTASNTGNNDVSARRRSVCFVTLGCKVNTAETEGMRHLFEAAGYETVGPDSPADVCVVNTCTVTGMGEKKSRQMLRRLRAGHPEAVIAAVGCYAQISPQEVSAIPGVDLVLGNNRKHTIVHEAEALMAGRRDRSPVVLVDARTALDSFEEMPISTYSGHTRAFIKIQDGCDRFCSYCIIPFARGPVRSRQPGEILAEVRRLVEKGFQEFVLAGIHLTSFTDREGREALPGLVRELARIAGVRRIRLGSLEPMFLSDGVLDAIASVDKVCPHFHLSLQSGCAATLSRMNRRYSPDDYRHIVAGIRSRVPDAAITTDVMTGFPGETEADFETSLSFCGEIGFAQMHVFPYSVRRGTRAASLPVQVPQAERDRRAARMQATADVMAVRYREGLAGKMAEVLVEGADGGWLFGHDRRYLPVSFEGPPEWAKREISVRLLGPQGDIMTAVAVSPREAHDGSAD